MTENRDNDHLRKLFVGGLNFQTTEESMKAFYENWGEVVECKVLKDKETGKSRCFGFLTFRESEMVDRCMSERPHNIDGRQVDSKRVQPKHLINSEGRNKVEPVKKIFVGGTKGLTEEEIREYFSKHGNITHFNEVTDKVSGTKKGFCFITFDDSDPVDKLASIGHQCIGSVRVEVKKATENFQKPRNGMRPNMPGGYPNNEANYYQDYSQQGYAGYGMWNGQAMWNLGTGYEQGNAGGAMKGPKHTKRSDGPYAYGNQPTPYGNPAYGNAYANPALGAPVAAYPNQAIGAPVAAYAYPTAAAAYANPAAAAAAYGSHAYGSQASNPAYGNVYDAGSQDQK